MTTGAISPYNPPAVPTVQTTSRVPRALSRDCVSGGPRMQSAHGGAGECLSLYFISFQELCNYHTVFFKLVVYGKFY